MTFPPTSKYLYNIRKYHHFIMNKIPGAPFTNMVGSRSAGDLMSQTSKVRILHSADEDNSSFGFENRLPVPEPQNWQ